MFRNYLKVAFRNLLKNKLFSVINILGMSLSLASVFVIGLFVMDELSYDHHIVNSENKFRVVNNRYADGGDHAVLPIVPYPFADYLKKDYPEIKSTARLMDTYGDVLIELDNKRFNEPHGVYAETVLIDMLSLQFLEGDANTALNEVDRIVLTQSMAQKYFGNDKAVGKMLKVSKRDFIVSGVIADPQDQFHLKINFLLSFPSLTRNWIPYRFENWINQQYFTYIELQSGTDVEAFNSKLHDFVAKYASPKTKPEGFYYEPFLQSITDIHLNSSSHQWEIAQRGNAQMVSILIIAAGLILVIACLNFVNLSTSRSIKRMKEVGVRKVVGAYRSQLTVQFVTESVLITVLSLVIGITLTAMLLPALNSFTEKNIADPFNLQVVASLLLAALLLGFIAGGYPALHLSSFKPSLIFANKEGKTGSVDLLRKGLVVTQFAFSFFLIISAMVVIQQHNLLQSKNLGFEDDQLVVIPLSREQLNKSEALKHEYTNHSHIVSAALSYGLPGEIVAGDGIIDAVTGKSWTSNMFLIDEDYISTLGIKVIAGRGFSKNSPADIANGFILNEEAVRAFGYGTPEQAIGKKVNWSIWGADSLKRGEVIGVVQDFHYRSLRDKIAPAVMHVQPQHFYTLTLRVKSDNLPGTLAHLKSTWEKNETEWPFDYHFLDENFDKMYKNEAKLSQLLTWFTGFAIFIACLGLFGLVEYNVNQRAKEISIRKVFGAGIISLLVLLTRRYFTLILISFVLIIPISAITAQKWLEGFAYHIEVEPLLYLKAGAMVIIITVVTVMVQSWRAATTNPAKILKNE